MKYYPAIKYADFNNYYFVNIQKAERTLLPTDFKVLKKI